MTANSASTNSGVRHFDRGARLATALPTMWLLLAACSGSLDSPNQPGTAGTAGGAGNGGMTGSGAIGGTTPTSPTCMMGTANYCGTTPTGGVGGTTPLPVCEDGTPTFGVCFVNDADVLPLPVPVNDDGTRTNGTITATIVDVGVGTAPAQCESARWFGEPGTSDWWFQARTADNRLWTIGLRGLGSVQLVRKDDSVTLDLLWRGYGPTTIGVGPPSGRLELSSASATPLLWAGANATTSSTGWLSLAPGPEACWPDNMPCDISRKSVRFIVNGNVATVAPFNADNLGGYYVAVGEIVETVRSSPACANYFGPPFASAAVKVFPEDP